MKKITFLLLLITGMLLMSCNSKSQIQSIDSEEKESLVYMTKDISPDGVMKLFEYVKDNVKGNVGIKVHFGEDGNEYFVPATMVEPLCKALNATLIETNTAYTGRRTQTKTHIELAHDHGFNFAPIDILDEGGTLEMPIQGGTHFKTALIGKNFEKYETIIYFTHFKGHGRSGFGGCIKNASMGMATPEGKKAMHFNDFPQTISQNCTKCQMCVADCPAGAITITDEGPVIDKTKCIGCGKCISTCHQKAIIKPDDAEQTKRFLEGLVEYAQPVIAAKNNIFFNVIINLSPSCDCSGNPKEPFTDNIAILVSRDIVAIEAAAHDLVDKATNSNDAFLKVNSVSGKHQIDYAEQLGMGKKAYRLIDIDKK